MRAALELEYVPSPAAANLASGRTCTVGMVAPFPRRWFFAEVLTAAETVLRNEGYDLCLYNIGDPSARAEFFRALPPRRRVDGLLIAGTSFTSAEQAALDGLRVPICLVGGALPGHPRVRIDDTVAAAMAVRHLLSLGHRQIAMISGDPTDPVGRLTTSARSEGYRSVLAESALPELLAVQPWGVTGGVRAMEELLTRTPLPTAVFAESDEMALGALQALRHVGLSAPRHVSVIGIDDHEMAEAGGLTTIAQPVREQAELAARTLLDALAGAPVPGTDAVLPVRLIVRGSTGPPPVN